MDEGGSDGGAAAGAEATAAGIAGGGSSGGSGSGSEGGEGGGGGSNGSANSSNNGSSTTSLMTTPAAAASAVPSSSQADDGGAAEAAAAARPQTPHPPPPPPPPPATTSAAASSAVAGLAKEAAMLFKAQRYAECLRVLEQLLQKKEDDPKVLHNIAVAEYYRDGCTDPQKLLDVLAKVKGRSEELARAEEEQLEGIGTASSNSQSVSSSTGSRSSTSATGGSGGQGQPAAPSGSGSGGGEAIAYMEDYDTSIPTLNTAVIFYHLQQYATALSVLEPLYQNIEPIDETAALRVCMLMLDITLASGQPTKAASVLQTMEKSFGYLVSPGEGGSSLQSQPPIQTQLLSSAVVGLASSGDGNALSSSPSSLINSPSGELGLTRTSSEEVLDEDSLSLSLDVEGSVRSVPSLPLPTGLSRVPNVEKVLPAPVVDLKLMLHLYKVRLLMLTRSLKATKREVKSALNLSRDHLTALVLKAQLEYSRANYRKAIKLLSTWSSRVESGMSASFLSNLGCIHHQLQKNQTAAVFFRKALQANATRSKESPLKLNTFSQDKSLSILYNAGLQQLVCGNPVLAACCFQEAGSLYYNQPLLWLRLAECCIMALEKGLLDSGNENSIPGKREDIRISVVGDGKWRRIVLPAGSLNPTATNGLNLEGDSDREEKSNLDQAPNIVEGNGAAPGTPQKLSMAFACQCLYAALHLLDKHDAKIAEAAAAVAAEAVAAEAVDVNDVDDVTTSTASQNQTNGTTERKGNITPASGGTSSQVSPNGDGKESKATSGTSGTITAAIASYEEEKRKEHLLIRLTVLADLGYVQLCLQNPIQALKTASALLSQPDCTQTHAFLGRLYAAEALCLLDRSREAADYLSVCLMENSTVENTVGSEEDGQKWKSGDNSEASGDGEDSTSFSPTMASGAEDVHVANATGSRARSSLYVNLAAVYVMQGDLAQARQWATQAVAITPANPLAVLAVVYVDLLSGQREEAINMLKRCRHLCVVSPNKVLWQKD